MWVAGCSSTDTSDLRKKIRGEFTQRWGARGGHLDDTNHGSTKGYKADKADLGVVDQGVRWSVQNLRCRKNCKQHKIVFRSEKGECTSEATASTSWTVVFWTAGDQWGIISVKKSTKNIGCGENDNGKIDCPIHLERRLRGESVRRGVIWKSLNGRDSVVQ